MAFPFEPVRRPEPPEAEPQLEPQLEPEQQSQQPEQPLPTMHQLDELSADLDDVDAVLARMDAQRQLVLGDTPAET